MGCDWGISLSSRPARNFNPRTPVGCDSDLVTLLPEPFQFQSTHPSGVRLTFQKLRFRHLAISIHAPQWGATVPYGCVFGVVVISIHAPQWGATRAALEPWARVANFNPRTPVGCDCPAFVTMRRTLIFQSTHPSGVRRHHVGRRRRAGPISIHAPQWGATVVNNGGALAMAFQSTHPSGVRPWEIWACMPISHISIHVPQWGATRRNGAKAAQPAGFQSTHPSGVRRFPLVVALGRELFQSTHPSGVRPRNAWFQDFRQDFNPRTPVGCDGLIVPPAETFAGISIHAPQWGATRSASLPWQPIYFNPRTPVGCDAQTGKDAGDHFKFQSTHPSGVRPGPVPATAVAGYFNPRTPVGCDLEMAAKRGDTEAISIHAPQWGATHALGHDNGAVGISIHAPQWGATARLGQAGVHRPISIHAPQWGATTITSIGKSGAGDFNPRTPVGCDLHQLDVQLNIIKFQSTHPSGVRLGVRRACDGQQFISIHAPQWGATTPYLLDKFIQQFQSTHPSGVRRSIVTPSSTWT